MTIRHAIDSCTLQLRSWRPFDETLSSISAAAAATNRPYRRVCRADRATPFSFSSALDLSKLCLLHGEKPLPFPAARRRRFARKRRRRGGCKSVSCRSSDRRCRYANGTCSDFLMAAGSTDSSGELLGEAHWASDVSERNLREKERNDRGEREFVISGYGLLGNCDIQVNESGYGSEPGYRGDVELEYGDELDDGEDDRRVLFWGEECGENTSQLQKGHRRCRRKKLDLRMADALG